MSEFKVGDKVFDLRYGNGQVEIVDGSYDRPVVAAFESRPYAQSMYFTNGYVNPHDVYPTLYHGHDLIVEVKEPEYEWQVLYKIKNSDRGFSVSQYYYKTVQNFKDSTVCDNQYHYCEFIEPSKRLVKRG